MTTKTATAAFLAVVGLLAFSGVAGAVTIPTLYDTGEDAAHVVLAGGNGVADPHYTIIAEPNGGAPFSAETFNCCYFADDAQSRWISVNESGFTGGSGTYVFRTTFDLTGFDPAQTSISVRCATDNLLNSLSLNGGATSVDCDGFGSFSAFQVISSGFVAGINTLDFSVLDQGAPMALRAEFTGTTSTPGTPNVPEPGTALLIATGAVALALYRRRR